MRLLRAPLIVTVWLLAGAAMLAPAPAAAQRNDLIDISIFYEDLNEGGDWFEHPRYGYVWSPDVDPYWRPYTRGRWIYTDDYGWFWDSDEPFGWAVYHYGRWGFDEANGWFWVPGRRWGPAWVAWRYGDDYCGWAPLPPGAVWSSELGIVYGSDFYVSVRYDPYWIFVRPQFLAYYNAYRFARPRSHNRYIIRYTRPSTGYEYVNGRMFNRGIGPRHYRRIARRAVPRTRVYFYHDSRPYKYRGWSRRGSARVFRPGKKRRYRATRTMAPRVVHKSSPRRETWKQRKARAALYKAVRAKAKSWRALKDRRRVRAKNLVIPGADPKLKAGLRGKRGDAKKAVRKKTVKRKLRAAPKTTAKSSLKRKGTKTARPKRNAKSKRRAKTRSKPKTKSKPKAVAKKKATPRSKPKVVKKSRPKRKAKPAAKSAGTKRAAKANRNGKGKGKGKAKRKAKNKGRT